MRTDEGQRRSHQRGQGPALVVASSATDVPPGAYDLISRESGHAGATGAGAAIAIIDSGFDLQSAELEGRLSAASQALAGNSSIDDEGGHHDDDAGRYRTSICALPLAGNAEAVQAAQ